MNYEVESDSGVLFHPKFTVERQPDRKERTSWHSMCPLVEHLFPITRSTAIPALVEEVINVLEPMCEAHGSEDEPLFIRGNVVPRLVLNGPPFYAPDGYWQIPEAFQIIQGKSVFVGEGSVATAVVDQLVAGPDIDIMLRKQSVVSDEDIGASLKVLAEQVNSRNKKLRVEVHPVRLSALNGESDPRIYSQVVFFVEHYRNWKPVLRVDIGEAPDNTTFHLDGRLSLYSTSYDAASVARLQKKEKHWYAVVDKESKHILRNRPVQVIASGANPGNKSVVGTRLMTQWLFWQRSSESLEHFVYRQRQGWNLHGTDWNSSSLPLIESYWNTISLEHLDQIERRDIDVACQCMLGLTIDPYAWLELARSTGFLGNTKLGVLLEDANIRTELTRDQASIDQKGLCDDFRLGVVEALSHAHRLQFPSTLSQVRYLGPLQVVRDLKRIGALPQDTPDTIASAIDLVSPASFLRQQTR